MRGFALGLTPSSHDHFVTILQESTGLTPRKINGSLAAFADLQDTAAFICAGAGYGPGAIKIPGIEITAITRVMGEHLENCPIHVFEVRRSDGLWGEPIFPHGLGRHGHVQANI